MENVSERYLIKGEEESIVLVQNHKQLGHIPEIFRDELIVNQEAVLGIIYHFDRRTCIVLFLMYNHSESLTQ